MAILLDGTGGVTTPGVVNTAGETIATTLSVTGATNLGALTTTGNTILGDASTDTLNVGNGGLVKDASGNVGIGTASPTERLGVLSALTGTTTGSNVVGRFQSNGSGYDCNIAMGDNVNASTRLGYLSGAMYFWTNGAEQARITTAGLLQFNSGYGSVATAYGCRAWVNFNGTGTVAIRGSRNVSSITDDGPGNYLVNFTTAMPDADYAAISGGSISGQYTAVKTTPQSTTQFNIDTSNAAWTWTDAHHVMGAVFR